MIRAIAAIDSKRGLATDTGIPWNLPTDRTYVREKTKGSNMLMGYNTYLEFTRPLPERRWYVLHEPTEPLREGFESVTDLGSFMEHPPENLWLFGGAGVFAQTIDYADELWLTRIEGDFDCTKFFPEFEDKFELAEQGDPQTENGITYHYEDWKKKHGAGLE
jgi:dihydrofolate reductase